MATTTTTTNTSNDDKADNKATPQRYTLQAGSNRVRSLQYLTSDCFSRV